MDQNRIANKKYHHLLDRRHVLIKRTLQMILPVSLASFIISYTCTRFSVVSSYHTMTSLVFPLFTHVFERKYMFLVCNAILAFLMKTLNLNSSNSLSGYSLSDLDGRVDSSDDSSSSTIIPAIHDPQSLSENFEDAVDGEDDHEEEEEEERCTTPQEEEDEVEDDHEEVVEEEDEVEDDHEEVVEEDSFFCENVLGDFVIESGGFDMDYEEEEYIGGEGLMGEEEQMEVMVNMNTEDLNRKFEEFIRKMKEELRIQEQQQWIIAV